MHIAQLLPKHSAYQRVMQVAYASQMEETESPRKKRRRQRLELLLREFGGAAQVARESGTPKSHFSAITSGARGVGDALAAKLESIYAKPEGWFDLPIEATDTSSAAPPAASNVAPAPAPGELAVRVPLLANAGSMGAGTEVQHDDVLVGHIALSEQWVQRRIQPTSTAALRFIHAYGDSMHPTFEDGDVLLVDTGVRDPSSIDGVYVMAANERIYIKRVRQRMDKALEVSSDNPTVKTVDVLNGDHSVDVLGRVVWCWNGRKL